MMLELVGSMASEPIDSEGWLSVIGVQFKPASIVFQTPPAAAPRKATSGFLGSTASAATRPELLGLPLKGNTPGATLIGCGPIEVHAEGPGKSVANGAAFSKGSQPILPLHLNHPVHVLQGFLAHACGHRAVGERPVAEEPLLPPFQKVFVFGDGIR